MELIDLCGNWTVREAGKDGTIKATVPGCIHTDLLAAKSIPDPFYRDNEKKLMWIGERDWIYAKEFTIPKRLLRYDAVILQCEGLDTLAQVRFNNTTVGRADNMFRRWEFDVTEWIRSAGTKNRLEIRFSSTFPYINSQQRKRYVTHTGIGHHRLEGANRVRKAQCNYGWDWGPMCVTCGIWRPLRIVAFDTARIRDVSVEQDHSRRRGVLLKVGVEVDRQHRSTDRQHRSTDRQHRSTDRQHRSTDRRVRSPLKTSVSVMLHGKRIAGGEVQFSGSSAAIEVFVENAQLWWPNGMGNQPLYEVRATLYDREGSELDRTVKSIGLRTLRLVRQADRWGESFYFEANGKSFFAKGANWIPADVFVTRPDVAQYEYLVKSAAEAHMNMLRVWGGGIYEQDIFYDLCDRYGICVWQDFMFSCGAYPAFDETFMENVRLEAEDNIRRLRHHASLALWCGNNEIEMIPGFIGDDQKAGQMSWKEYKSLFDRLLPRVVRRTDPQRDYWPSSSHSPRGDRSDANNPRWGDAHLWSVWHGREPFEWYRGCEHRFNSEFGFQSFPEPRMVDNYTEMEDRNVTSYVMEHHQRSRIGNEAIITYMLDWFRLPRTFEMTLWLSQILQGLAIKYAVENWRRKKPQGMGTLYWQLNDCWPVASWSSIDYNGRWKALHFMAKRFFTPLLISGVENREKASVDVYVSSDLLMKVKGDFEWSVTDTSGEILEKGRKEMEVAPEKSVRICTLRLRKLLSTHGARRIMVWLVLQSENGIRSTNMACFTRPKHLEMKVPQIKYRLKELKGNRFRLILSSRIPALWVWIDLKSTEASYSDNFFHLYPGGSATVDVFPKRTLSLARFEKELNIRSLADTY